jgi:hypothetical protein
MRVKERPPLCGITSAGAYATTTTTSTCVCVQPPQIAMSSCTVLRHAHLCERPAAHRRVHGDSALMHSVQTTESARESLLSNAPSCKPCNSCQTGQSGRLPPCRSADFNLKVLDRCSQEPLHNLRVYTGPTGLRCRSCCWRYCDALHAFKKSFHDGSKMLLLCNAVFVCGTNKRQYEAVHIIEGTL